ncbi:MAG: AsmA family protein [Flavobacterium sp.]|nr:AsmA family protein [Candidatus Neoflavobacterium equi]
MNAILLKQKALKALKIGGITIASFLLILFVTPFLFKDYLIKNVKILAAENVNAKIDFSDLDVSFFKKFPNLTVVVENPKIIGLGTFADKQLLDATAVSVGVNVIDLIKGDIVLDAIYIDDANLDVIVDKDGNVNYNIFKSDDEKTEASSASLKFEKVKLSNANIAYQDLTTALFVNLKKVNYTGSGNLSADIFQLQSLLEMQSMDVIFDKVHYIQQKPFKGDIITKVDSKSLKFSFEKNDIKINTFPFSFSGTFGFIENGYDMDLHLKSANATFSDLLTLVPQEYGQWKEETKIDGDLAFNVDLVGKFLQDFTEKPTLKAFLSIHNGSIANKNVKLPLRHLEVNATAFLPDLDVNALKLDIEQLDFSLNKEWTKIKLHSLGKDPLNVNGFLKSKLNLDLFQKAIGLNAIDIKGDLDLDLTVDGNYATSIVTSGLRNDKIDTIISSIPKFNLKASLSNGYFKKSDLPHPVKNINFALNAQAKDSIYKNISVDLQGLNAQALTNFVKGNFKLSNLNDYPIDADLQASLKLEELEQFFPVDSIVLKGDLGIDFKAKGRYLPASKEFPVSSTWFKLKNGYIKLLAIPDLPIEAIDIETRVTSKKGSFKDLLVEVLPITFKIAGEPFRLDANLYNLENLNYNINSKGKLNLGQIYKLFKIDGLNIDGMIKTNLSLKGISSDALAGNYSKLSNSGTLEVENIAMNSDMFPKSFFINKGLFRFFKDKMRFEEFKAQYGSSNFRINGQINNVLHALNSSNQKINGSIIVNSSYLNADEFMVYAPSNSDQKANQNTNNNAAGVILIPDNLNIEMMANIKKIDYSDLKLENFKGRVTAVSSGLIFDEAKFDLAGTKVDLKGNYKPKNTKSAQFDMELAASNFDIQRAYKEIPLFRDLITMAKDAYGLISLDYNLKGVLDQNMEPVMKSLQGSGKMTLENIKFKNFKLLGGIADKTDTPSLTKGNLNDVVINTHIKNNVMTIERTKMKMAGFRPRFEGQVTLDGKMNIGFRLGLPPLGIIGIPMKITGTSDKFKIALGRYKEDESLEENTD